MGASVFVDYAGKERKIAVDEARQCFDEIPVIDLSPWLKPGATTEEKMSVVKLVGDACTRVGFLYLKGHGLSQEVMDGAMAAAGNFFALSEKEKMEVYFKKSPAFRGYEPQKGPLHAAGHIKEAFSWSYEPAADPLNPSDDAEEYFTRNPSASPNVWPSTPNAASLKPSLYAYYSQVLVLGREMIKIFALALDLPEHYFDEAFREPGASARCMYYPPQPPMNLNEDGEIGIASHTDIEAFTFLLQGPDVSCLQVLNLANEWVEAPPIPQTLVLNIGDLLARWTNERFVSNVHRVINKGGKSRQSMGIFFGPAFSTEITALPTCIKAGQKPIFNPISAGDYVLRRMVRSRLGIEYDESQSMESIVDQIKSLQSLAAVAA